MKKYIVYLLCLIPFCLTFSCKKLEEVALSDNSSITAINVRFNGTNRLFPGTINDGNIIVQVPIHKSGTDELIENDLSNMDVLATLPQGAVITPGLSTLKDFSTPQDFTVKAADGQEKKYTLSVVKTGMEYTIGLLEFSVRKHSGAEVWFKPNAVPPYLDGQTIVIDVPDTPKEPLDLTKIYASFKLQPTCTIEPVITDNYIDFTQPLEIKVTDGMGTVRTHFIQINPTKFVKTRVSHLWFRSITDLDLTRSNIKAMALTNDYFAISEFNDWSLGTVFMFDTEQGRFIKQVTQPAAMYYGISNDDNNNLLAYSYNNSGAGYDVQRFNASNSTWERVFKTVSWHPTIDELGANAQNFGTNKMQVTGNVITGKSYVYTTTTTALFPKYYWWELNDGMVVLSADRSSVNNTGSAIHTRGGSKWEIANVQRASNSADSDLYISWYNQGANETDGLGSKFEIVDGKTSAVHQLNPLNHPYKILAFDVFTLNGDKFVAMLTQGMGSSSESKMIVFDITDKTKLALAPNSPGYVDLKMYESSNLGITTDLSSGDIKVNVIDAMNADIFVACTATSTATAANAGVRKFRIQYQTED